MMLTHVQQSFNTECIHVFLESIIDSTALWVTEICNTLTQLPGTIILDLLEQCYEKDKMLVL